MTGTYDPPPGRYDHVIEVDIFIAHMARDAEYRDQMIRRLRPMERVRFAAQLEELHDVVGVVINESD